MCKKNPNFTTIWNKVFYSSVNKNASIDFKVKAQQSILDLISRLRLATDDTQS